MTAKQGPRRDTGGQQTGAASGTSGTTVQQRPDAAGELAAWGAAVVHLHAAGLPAACPPFPAAWLARRGIRADWTAAA